MKIWIILLLITVLALSGCVESSEDVGETTGAESVVDDSSSKNCDTYALPMSESDIEECTCPENEKKFRRLDGAYCAASSHEPCNAHSDCAPNEECISEDGLEWYCSGQFAGCLYRDPKDPESGPLCMD